MSFLGELALSDPRSSDGILLLSREIENLMCCAWNKYEMRPDQTFHFSSSDRVHVSSFFWTYNLQPYKEGLKRETNKKNNKIKNYKNKKTIKKGECNSNLLDNSMASKNKFSFRRNPLFKLKINGVEQLIDDS